MGWFFGTFQTTTSNGVVSSIIIQKMCYNCNNGGALVNNVTNYALGGIWN